jgi:hypothetical protein
MRIRLNHLAPLLGAGAVAAAVAVAPIAANATTAAAPPPSVATAAATASSDPGPAQQSCAGLGGTQTECLSPGNSQLYDAPPQVDYFPYAGGAT